MDNNQATALVLEALLRCLERRQPGLAPEVMDELANMQEAAEKAKTPVVGNTQEAILTWGNRLQTISADIADERMK